MTKVLVIMGSDSDMPVVKGAVDILRQLEIETEVHISSAHRAAGKTEELARNAANNDVGVIIAAAGGAAHLAGVIAAQTPLPVIALPIQSGALSGVDALYAMVQMPSGIPCATVAIDGAKNAGLLAAQILGVADRAIMQKIIDYKENMRLGVEKKDAKLQELGVDAYLAQK